MAIIVVDYGMGNLRSVHKALEHVGLETAVSTDPDEVRKADKLVLPGVGACADAMSELGSRNLVEPILEVIEKRRPFLGICLGMQLLLEISYEGGENHGLGVFPGAVRLLEGENLKVPHIGWNQIEFRDDCPLFAGLRQGTYVYFDHSYYADPEDRDLVAAETEYGVRFASALWKDNVYATQFHPEKSQKWGLKMLENFGRL